MVVEGVWLEQVEDAEAVGGASDGAAQPEVEPLRVAPRVQVRTQHELVVELPPEGGDARACVSECVCECASVRECACARVCVHVSARVVVVCLPEKVYCCANRTVCACVYVCVHLCL